jgi:GR25 family glycosyltransferase involved in LPS biosynthesis
MNVKTFVINLERRTDRLNELKIPFEYEVFSATDGRKSFDNERYSSHELGQLGCRDSHKRLLSKIYEDGVEHCLIFEDDVELCNNFEFKLEEIIKELPEDWDMVYLGGWNLGEKKSYTNKLNIAEKVYTTHSYLIRRKFIPLLIDEINKDECKKVDVIFSVLQKQNKCFIASPILCWQRKGFSDVENTITNNTHLL